MSKKVMIDAGHYGNMNPGTEPGYYEAKMSWSLSRYLGAELETYGIPVAYTRQDQTKDLALFDRGEKATDCRLFISLHSNGEKDKLPGPDYPVAYTMLDGSTDALGLQLAKTVQTMIPTVQEARVVHQHSSKGENIEYYGVLRGAASVGTPGLILEHSFHTNPAACKWLYQDSNLRKLAKAEAAVIAEHLGAEKQDQRPMVELVDAPVKVGGSTVNGILVGGTTYVPLREFVDALKGNIAVTWTKADGAGVKL